MRAALLRGREHLHLGAVDSLAEGPVAIAISVGGRRKVYAHTDPNEDAAFFAWDETGALVAVADGHGGFEAAEVALEHLAASPAPQWLCADAVHAASWQRQVLAVLCDVNEHILRELAETDRPRSETTLALALVLPRLDLLLHASIGDSHVFRLRGEEVVDLARRDDEEPTCFLGRSPETPESLLEKCSIGAAPLAGVRAVVLATDGLSAPKIGVATPADVVSEAAASASRELPALRARETARRVVEAALDAHRRNASGDNASAAVVWLDP